MLRALLGRLIQNVGHIAVPQSSRSIVLHVRNVRSGVNHEMTRFEWAIVFLTCHVRLCHDIRTFNMMYVMLR